MAQFRYAALCLAALCAGGCGSSDEPGTTGTGGAGGAGGAGSTSSTSAASTSQSSSGAGGDGQGGTGGGAATTTVVVNEISAKGSDWIELGNVGPGSADLGGLGLCDSDDSGQCNTADALRFPEGTQLAPGAYLLVLGDQAPEDGPGPHTTCLPDGGPSSCFYATWKVSASRGETVYLISANDQVLAQFEYPMEAAADGQTWGRLPDLTGEGAATAPTPGAKNEAP
ncbi:lamin tail domain-containing protein [Sorangium sp. So ce1000]|uniref:lamin tail domain-containing protein n=1 Tax=Sorangium sp. So ce1000 TaxID=3133325 RepID=UPI003F60D48E